MPFFRCFGPASNCGLISATSCAGRRSSRIERRQHQLERDEADIDRGEIRRLGETRRIERADVGLLERDDRRMAAQPRVQLTAPDIDRVDAPRTAREQHLGEAAGRGADIEADAARRIEAEMIERRDKLQRRRARPTDAPAARRSARIGRDLVRGLAQHDAIGRHAAGRDRGLRPGAALEQAALDQQHVGALALCHAVDLANPPQQRQIRRPRGPPRSPRSRRGRGRGALPHTARRRPASSACGCCPRRRRPVQCQC